MGTPLTTTEEMYLFFAERDGDDSPSYRRLAYEVLASPALLALGIEGASVLPHVGAGAGRFAMSLDDRLLAYAHPHGRRLEWL